MSTNKATFSEDRGQRTEDREEGSASFLSSVLCPLASGFFVHPHRRARRRKLRGANGGRWRRRDTPKNFSITQRVSGPRSRRLASREKVLPRAEKVASRARTQSERSRPYSAAWAALASSISLGTLT